MRMLSPHFSFEELTVTNQLNFQDQNRLEAEQHLPTLIALANRLLEPLRGERPLKINSAFRWWALNSLTPGSSQTSQHPLGQAADITRPGQPHDEFFEEVLAKLVNDKIPFGQLIDEAAARDYGVARWVHVSLGPDFWKPERCGEVIRIVIDEEGKATRSLLRKVAVAV